MSEGDNSAPITPRRAQTQQKLMTAAVAVFAEKGVAGASVEELCEAAGFTRGAFYSNFESKDALCFALFRQVADDAMAALKSTLAGIDPDPLDATDFVETAVDLFLSAQATDRAAALLVREMELYALRHPDFAQTYQALEDETHTLFARVIGAALTQQQLRAALPAKQVVEVLHAVHRSAQSAALLDPTLTDPLAAQLKAVLTALIRTG